MKRFVTLLIAFAIAAGTLTVCMYSRSAWALSTAFTQQILPLDCIFTVVNAGTGQLYFVTPAACGVANPTPATPATGSVTGPATRELAFPYAPTSNTGTTGEALGSTQLLPWQPVARPLTNTSTVAPHINLYVVAAIIVGFVLLTLAAISLL